jgi:hypothetical protein
MNNINAAVISRPANVDALKTGNGGFGSYSTSCGQVGGRMAPMVSRRRG